MAQPAVVAVYGNSDSGKTELVVELLEDFVDEGESVCTVKHTPAPISLDEEGKDTWRHREAGSELLVFSTEVETDFLFPREMELEEVMEKVSGLGDYDLVIAEGYKDEEVPKVAVGDIAEREGTLTRYDGDREKLKGLIEREMGIKELEEELPALDCGRCGYEDCRGLAEAIYDGDRSLEDCEVREESTVELEVDGEKVPLENFPALMIKEGLKGMLSSLKGVNGEIGNISLKVVDRTEGE